MRQMTGTVTGSHGPYFTVECPDAPPHLFTLELIPSQMGGAKVGDSVRLEYQTTATSGLWNVVAVLPTAALPTAAGLKLTVQREAIVPTGFACYAPGDGVSQCPQLDSRTTHIGWDAGLGSPSDHTEYRCLLFGISGLSTKWSDKGIKVEKCSACVRACVDGGHRIRVPNT